MPEMPNETITLRAEYVCEFTSFGQWVNKASKWIGRFGGQQKIICVDKNGDYIHQGSDMMYADEKNLFPVKCYRLIRNTEPKPPHP